MMVHSTANLGEFLQHLASTLPPMKELYFGPIHSKKLSFDPNSDYSTLWTQKYSKMMEDLEKQNRIQSSTSCDPKFKMTIIVAETSSRIWAESKTMMDYYTINGTLRSSSSRIVLREFRSKDCTKCNSSSYFAWPKTVPVKLVNDASQTERELDIFVLELFETNILEKNGFHSEFRLEHYYKISNKMENKEQSKICNTSPPTG